MSLNPQWKSFLFHEYAHSELCWHWRWSSEKALETLVKPLLWITLNQLGHDERMQGVNPIRACESPSRKVLEGVRTFYSLINSSLRSRLQRKDKLRIKTFRHLKNWIIILRMFSRETHTLRKRKRGRQAGRHTGMRARAHTYRLILNLFLSDLNQQLFFWVKIQLKKIWW